MYKETPWNLRFTSFILTIAHLVFCLGGIYIREKANAILLGMSTHFSFWVKCLYWVATKIKENFRFRCNITAPLHWCHRQILHSATGNTMDFSFPVTALGDLLLITSKTHFYHVTFTFFHVQWIQCSKLCTTPMIYDNLENSNRFNFHKFSSFVRTFSLNFNVTSLYSHT